jgi:hypothetical protein
MAHRTSRNWLTHEAFQLCTGGFLFLDGQDLARMVAFMKLL